MISQESHTLQGDVQFCGTLLLRYMLKQVKKKSLVQKYLKCLLLQNYFFSEWTSVSKKAYTDGWIEVLA